MTKTRVWSVGPNRNGSYRLPQRTYDLLCVRLRGFKNHEAALTLAVFLCRMHAVPNRMGHAFPVDRRALLTFYHPSSQAWSPFPREQTLDLTEDQIRGAIKTLEKIGFLDRQEPLVPPRQKPMPDAYETTVPTKTHVITTRRFGADKVVEVRRRAILFQFGSDFEAPLMWNAKAPKYNSPIRRVGLFSTSQDMAPVTQGSSNPTLLMGDIAAQSRACIARMGELARQRRHER